MAAIVVAAVSVAAAEERAPAPLHVWVTIAEPDPGPVPSGDFDTGTSLKLKRESVRQMRKALQNRLQQDYGKDRSAWPPEKQAELVKLEDAEALAQADFDYRRSDRRGVLEVAKEMMAAFESRRTSGRPERTRLAATESEADLVVNVAAARTGKTFPTQSRPDRCYVLFTIGPGTTMSASRFAQVPSTYVLKKLGLNAWKVAGPRPDAPAVYVEAYNGGGQEFGCQAGAAAAACAAVDRFVEDNYQVLTAK